MTDETAAKWVEVLVELLPSSSRFGVVHDASLTNREQFENARRAAATLRREAISLEIESLDGLDAAIALARREAVASLIFVSSLVFTANAGRIVEAVRASGLPAVYESRWLVEKGGLMAYGPDFDAALRRAASLADRLLKGARPADLPIEQPTSFTSASIERPRVPSGSDPDFSSRARRRGHRMRRRELPPALAAAAVPLRGTSGRARHAGRRLSQRPLARRDGEPPRRLPPRPRGGGLPRWRARANLIPLGGRTLRERLPALAAELVERRVAVIATAGGNVTALAAKAATPKIPIVFVAGGDPIGTGLVASLSRPGGNVTGVSLFIDALGPKRSSSCASSLIAILVNPRNSGIDRRSR